MATTQTTLYGFTKPDGTEYVNVSVLNANWDKVDEALGGKQKKITVSENEPTSSDGEVGDIWIVIG